MQTSSRTVVAVFDDYATAERAVADLVSNGFSRDSINITSNDSFASDSAMGNIGLSGEHPRDRSGGGIGGFFRRLFGADDEYAGHYDEAIRRGAAVVSVNTDDEDRASDILDRSGAIDVEERAASWHREGYEASTDRRAIHERGGKEERSIPVVREDLHVGKRDVHRGGVRVFNRVTEKPVEEEVQLREEHVKVDRRPANRPATEADFRAQDEVIEVTEMAEEPVVGKTARVVEEVVVGKDTTHRTEKVRDSVRQTDVKVEKLGTGERAFADYDSDFREDFRTRYGTVRGAKYETYAPAYQYGHRMASDQRYQGRSWNDVESTLRTDYEREYPGGKWEQMKDSVRYGWEKVTGRR
jgi:uncharacterized protein (TIGR02271 family)